MPHHHKQLAIISGGDGYLGSALCVALERAGWVVAILARHAPTVGKLLFQCDITNEKEVSTAIETITKAHGHIDACIHAAAALSVGKIDLLATSAESFDKPIAVAARGAFVFAKAAMPHMKKDSAFIGITSTLIEPGVSAPRLGSYIASKYALRGFLRTLSAEKMSQGIRVYAVAPGFMPGGLNKDLPEAVLKMLASKSGAGETIVEDVAAVIEKICTQPDAYAPGSSISVPGGTHAL